MIGRKIPVSERALQLHRESLVLDCHSHFLINGALLGRKFHRAGSRPWFYNPFRNHLDLDAAVRGGLDAVAFTSYVGGRPFVWSADSATERILDRYEAILEECGGRVVHCTTPGAVRAAVADGKLASFLAIEGGHVLEGALERLVHLHARGVRMLTLTHFVSNGIADSGQSPYRPLRGLSDFGREVVREMERLGMMVDVAHCSDPALKQVLDHAQKPVIYSHGALRRYKPDYARNLPDELAREIAAGGGMVGVIFFLKYLGRAGWDMRAVARHAADIAELCGPEAVCVGSDLDGYTYTPTGFTSAADWPQLTQALLDIGFSEAEIRGILGENFLRYWERVTR